MVPNLEPKKNSAAAGLAPNWRQAKMTNDASAQKHLGA
jgi:hypothetical protein